MDILSMSSLLQTFGTIISAVIIVISLVTFQRPKKNLAYEVSFNRILSDVGDHDNRLTISLMGKPLSSLGLVAIKIINNGNRPIMTNDYESPIRFMFETSTEIISTRITDTNPVNLPGELFIAGSTVSLKPILLNPGDYLRIEILLSPAATNMSVDWRVVGVKSIRQIVKFPT